MAGSVGMMGMSSTTTKSFSSAEKKFSVEGATDSAFSVISDAAEQEFRQAAQDYVDGFTVRSGESDMITLEDVTKTERR